MTYLLAHYCDDVIKAGDWRKKERAIMATLAQVRSKQGHGKQRWMRESKEKNKCEVKQMLQTRE